MGVTCATTARCRCPSLTLPARGGGKGGALRAHPRLCHRPCQPARRDPVPSDARKRKVLTDAASPFAFEPYCPTLSRADDEGPC